MMISKAGDKIPKLERAPMVKKAIKNPMSRQIQ